MPDDPDLRGKVLPHRAAASRASGSLSVLPPAALFDALARSRGSARLVMRDPASGGLVVVVFRNGEPTVVFSPGDGRSVGELLLAAAAIDRETLDALVEERQQGPSSLERLVLDRTTLSHADVQRYLDFQARMRLLDALVWREGFFEIQEYPGGVEEAFRLELPSLESLVVRAAARAEALPGLLDRLPAPPALTLVRRRRGGVQPPEPLAAAIWSLAAEPLLIPQLVARLLVDDDIVIATVLDLEERRLLAVQPRAALAAAAAEPVEDPRLGSMIRQVLETTRGGAPAERTAALWLVVVAAAPDDATSFVRRIGGEPGVVMVGDQGGGTGLASATLRADPDARLCLLALRPEMLVRGVLEAVVARCDAVVLLRTGSSSEELDRLQQLRRVAEGPGFGWQPLALGLDLGSGLRAWGEFPDAVLGLPEWSERGGSWLAERLLEGLLAAATGRTSRSD